MPIREKEEVETPKERRKGCRKARLEKAQLPYDYFATILKADKAAAKKKSENAHLETAQFPYAQLVGSVHEILEVLPEGTTQTHNTQ